MAKDPIKVEFADSIAFIAEYEDGSKITSGCNGTI